MNLNEETATKLAKRYYEENRELKRENEMLKFRLQEKKDALNGLRCENINLKTKIRKLYEKIFYLQRLIENHLKDDAM